MTSEIDVLKLALEESRKALKLKEMNHELCEHLQGSLFWLFRYSEKYSIPIPKKEEILSMVERADHLMDEIILFDQPTGNRENNYRRGNSTQ